MVAPSDGIANDRASASDNVEVNPKHGQRGQDVAEHDHSVWSECSPRLQG